MRVIERTIEHPEDEGVILEYVKLTKDFAEIKEYVKRKGDTITGSSFLFPKQDLYFINQT